MRRKIVIWGASGHARVVADILRLCGEYEIVGVLDDLHLERRGEIIGGVPVLGGREQLDKLRSHAVSHLIFGFGDCDSRLCLAGVAATLGYEFATAIHPCATVASGVPVGAGTVIVAGAVVNPAASVGRHCIINTCASVDHDCVIADGVHLSPGVHLGGWVTVGEATWIGIGATVRDRIKIGDHSIIGAGALVLEDVPPSVLVYGVPAKVVRNLPVNAVLPLPYPATMS
jgi:acetyltransferase EpsM